MIFDNTVICPVFIGRENDLQLLDRLMMQSRDRSGQIALISGEAAEEYLRPMTRAALVRRGLI